MNQPTRRELMRGAASAGALLLAPPTLALRGRGSRDPLEELTALLIDTPRDRLLGALRPLLKSGAVSWRELGAAVFHAGVREIRPRPVGFKLHAVMVVEPMFQLAEGASKREATLAMLWNLDDFKRAQARDASEGDWRLAPPPRPRRGPHDARAELRAALDARDVERADQALVGAHAELELREVFALLWPLALRDFHNLGHKPIYCAHVQRVLRRVDGARALPALRALVYGLLADGGHAELFEESRALAVEAGSPPVEPAEPRPRPVASLQLAVELRSASPREARARVQQAAEKELPAARIWDALRIVAADLFARKPGLLPVHPTTVTNALHYIAHGTGSDNERLALLQAAAWLPLYRAALDIDVETLGGIDPYVTDLDAFGHVEVDELFAEPTPEATRCCLVNPRHRAPFERALRTHLLRAAREHHEPKYAAALLEDLRTADRYWHPSLLASALEYLPSTRTPTAPASARALELLDELGYA